MLIVIILAVAAILLIRKVFEIADAVNPNDGQYLF